MLLPKVVVVASFLVTVLLIVSARPRPGVTRVRHIIHAPIKFRIIHHYKVQKVPIIVKKHVHYLSPHPKEALPLEDEGHSNDIQFEHVDEEGSRHRHIHHFYGDHHEEEQQEEEDDDDDEVHGYRNPTPFYHGINHDYDETHQQQSQEADYEDYEYE